jgi:hypothetical protein
MLYDIFSNYCITIQPAMMAIYVAINSGAILQIKFKRKRKRREHSAVISWKKIKELTIF